MRYTPDEVLTIKKHAGVKSTQDIAAILDRSYQSVVRKAGELNISLRLLGEDHYNAKLSNLQVEMIHSLHVCGFKIAEIHKAAFNHVDYNTIHAVVNAYNRKKR